MMMGCVVRAEEFALRFAEMSLGTKICADLLPDISSPANWVLILSRNSHRTIKLIYEKFPSTHGKNIRLTTRYFNADIPLDLKHVAQLPGLLNNSEFIQSLQDVPAVVVICEACDDISEFQQAWDSIKNRVREDAARVLLLLDGASVGENQNLLEWAVLNEVEIVSEDSCQGSSVAQRFIEVLSCAPWRIQSHNVPSRAVGTEQTNSEAVRPKGQSLDHQILKVREEELASEAFSAEEPEGRTISNLSEATRLRRGLLQKDISNILNDLLLADSDRDDADEDRSV
ncbi:hypothetical protein FGB62_1g025 [Gracilaria domingensis]|nr:hypothetical protein FGB62_1g025 [Gracilaria domingensis]